MPKFRSSRKHNRPHAVHLIIAGIVLSFVLVFLIQYMMYGTGEEIVALQESYIYIQSPEESLTEYRACGCGCCGGVESPEACLYKSRGESLEKIREEDLAVRDDEICNLVGCSAGVNYSYCD